MKYVVSESKTSTDWKNTTFLKNAEDIKELKSTDGPNLHVWGSGNLIQTLHKNDLVDELRLKMYPLTLGQGKKLFAEGTMPAAFMLAHCESTPSGLILADYQRAGEVRTGRVGE